MKYDLLSFLLVFVGEYSGHTCQNLLFFLPNCGKLFTIIQI